MSSKNKTTTHDAEARAALVPKLRFPGFQATETWKPTTLGEVGSIYKGKGISKADINPSGLQPCIRYGELYTRYGETIKEVVSRTAVPISELFLSKVDDVIIPSSGETKIDIAKASCVLAADIAIGGDLNVIRSKFNGTFLSYYLNGPKRFDIAKVAQGDAVVHLYPHQLEALPLAYPSPVEQQKIADCLSSVDELMVSQIRKVDALKTHKEGLMQQLFPGDGESMPKLRLPEFHNSGKWLEMRLDDIGRVIRGASPRPKGDPRYYGGPIPRLMVQDVTRDGKYVTPRIDSLTMEGAKLSRSCKAGTLTIVCSGTVGVVSFLAVDACIHDGFLALIEIDESKATKDFLYHSLSTLRFRFEEGATHGGVFTNLTTSIVQQFSIKCPNLSEQQKIAACLSSLDDLIASENEILKSIKYHKTGLMQQLFPSSNN